jgi:class 3 adenylate cyclase
MLLNRDNRVPKIAHVLFMDVVAYSRLPTDHQIEVRDQLRVIVRGLPEFNQALSDGHLISCDTGDGMALAFFGDLTAPAGCARKITESLQINPHFKLRMGIHTGPVYVDTGINSAPNLAGDGINIAQRVMDLGDGGHILISKATADMLSQISVWKAAIHDLGEIEVKHGVRVQVSNLFTSEFGNPDLPSKIARAQQRDAGEQGGGAFPDDPAELFTEYVIVPATEDDIRWAARLAQQVYRGDDVIPEPVMLDWYRANPNGFSVMKSTDGARFGNLDILPLRPATLARLIEGSLLERHITGDCLYRPNETSKITDLYIESIVCVVDPAKNIFRPNHKAAALVHSEFGPLVRRVCDPRRVKRVLAIAASRNGINLLSRLGFSKLGATQGHDLLSCPFDELASKLHARLSKRKGKIA